MLLHLVALLPGDAHIPPSTQTATETSPAPVVATAQAVLARQASAQPAPVAVESSRAAQVPTEALSGPEVHHGLAVVPAPTRTVATPAVTESAVSRAIILHGQVCGVGERMSDRRGRVKCENCPSSLLCSQYCLD